MQLTTTYEQLARCLDYVISVIPASRVDPILSHVLIRAKKGKITLIGTNHEVQMTASCDGECDGALERIVPADKLRRMLGTFGTDTVIKMDFADDEVTISADKSTFKLMTQKTDRFTLLGETSEMKALETLSCEEFQEAMNKVQHATADESHRRALNGVLLHRSEEGIDFVGTDGHRMVVKTLDKPCKKSDSHIIPVKTIRILAKHIGSAGEVKISANDRAIRVVCGQFELISSVIQENYPDYKHVIPRNNEHQAIVERAELKKSLDRVIALSELHATAFLEFSKGKLAVSSNNADNDTMDDQLDISYTGAKIKMAFSANYLVQFLGVCKEQMMEFNLSSPENSVLIRPVEEAPSVNFVIMPVRS